MLVTFAHGVCVLCCVLQDAFKLAVWGSLESPPSQKKAAAGTKRKAAEVDVSAQQEMDEFMLLGSQAVCLHCIQPDTLI
jgi:hypothetical protein